MPYTRGVGGEGSSTVKVLRDVPPARVYFFKLSSLAKGILFANFNPFSLGKGMHFVNVGRFSGQRYTFWKFRSQKFQTSVIPVKKPKSFQILVQRMQRFGKFCQENA